VSPGLPALDVENVGLSLFVRISSLRTAGTGREDHEDSMEVTPRYYQPSDRLRVECRQKSRCGIGCEDRDGREEARRTGVRCRTLERGEEGDLGDGQGF
jgi:hypothetical protein